MRKLFLLFTIILLVFALVCTFVSCGKNGEEEDEELPVDNGKTLTLNVYNWGEYIADGSADPENPEEQTYDTNAEFEKYYFEKYGQHVKIVYSTYDTNENMYSKVQNSVKNNLGLYDLIIPSDYMIQKMAEENLLLSFDVAADIENYQYIDPQFKGMYYDKEQKYSVPYSYGVVGIIYNTQFVDEEDVKDRSWGLLWNKKYRNKILQFNNPRDAFGTAMYYKNLDINSQDPAVWQQAYELLLSQKPLVQGYVSDEIFNKMETGSAIISTYYAGDYITMRDKNEDLAFYYPREGTNFFVDAMCIPADARQPALAKEYINFMLSKDTAVANAEYIGYASPNLLVANNGVYDPHYLDAMGDEALEILYGVTLEDINENYDHNPFYESFTPEVQAKVNSLWESLKTESAIEPWIHVFAIGIVVGVVALAVSGIVRRKKRMRDYMKYVESLTAENKTE